MKKYPVMMGSTTVGWITKERFGLYDQFECRCIFEDGLVHRMVMYSGNRQIEMGVFVPEAGDFVIRKRLPVKDIPSGPLEFRVDRNRDEVCIWQEGQDLPNVFRLKNAKLRIRDGVYTMVADERITDQVQCPQGNGPNPSPQNK